MGPGHHVLIRAPAGSHRQRAAASTVLPDVGLPSAGHSGAARTSCQGIVAAGSTVLMGLAGGAGAVRHAGQWHHRCASVPHGGAVEQAHHLRLGRVPRGRCSGASSARRRHLPQLLRHEPVRPRAPEPRWQGQ
eukprot:11187681-Lingulodinium_polyedra.AAC.1